MEKDWSNDRRGGLELKKKINFASAGPEGYYGRLETQSAKVRIATQKIEELLRQVEILFKRERTKG